MAIEDDIFRKDQFARQKKFAWILGLSGLVPFVACALVLLILGMDNPLSEPVVSVFRAYSVVILSFLGGIRWGHALIRANDEISAHQISPLIGSVIPSLIAWMTVFFSNEPALAILLLAFCAQGAWDSLSANVAQLPKWFAPLRMVLTAIVAATHIIVFLVII